MEFYDVVKYELFENGWPDALVADVVIMPPDGELIPVGHTIWLSAARELGLDRHGNPITPRTMVRDPRQKLTAEERQDMARGGSVPNTWGEAALLRHRERNSP